MIKRSPPVLANNVTLSGDGFVTAGLVYGHVIGLWVSLTIECMLLTV